MSRTKPKDPVIDIWRCANELIKQYGDLADIEAAARADEHEAMAEAKALMIKRAEG